MNQVKQPGQAGGVSDGLSPDARSARRIGPLEPGGPAADLPDSPTPRHRDPGPDPGSQQGPRGAVPSAAGLVRERPGERSRGVRRWSARGRTNGH